MNIPCVSARSPYVSVHVQFMSRFTADTTDLAAIKLHFMTGDFKIFTTATHNTLILLLNIMIYIEVIEIYKESIEQDGTRSSIHETLCLNTFPAMGSCLEIPMS